MKNLKNLKGAKTLNKSEQKSISGGQFGVIHCNSSIACTSNQDCTGFCRIPVGSEVGCCLQHKY